MANHTTGAERRNARMHKIFENAYALARKQGKSSPWDKEPHCNRCGHPHETHECIHFAEDGNGNLIDTRKSA